MKVETLVRSVPEIEMGGLKFPVVDPEGLSYLNEGRVSTFRHNPFLSDDSSPAQFLGLVQNEVIGGINLFPIEVVAEGKIFDAVGGDSLYVREKYRSTMYSIPLMDKLNNISKDGISLCAGFTAKSLQVIKVLGNAIFPLRQFLLIRKTRPFFNRVDIVRKFRCLSCVVDLAILPYKIAMHILSTITTPCIRILPISETDREKEAKAFSAFICRDKHPYRENVTAEWIQWVLTNDFAKKNLVNKQLVKIVKGGVIVGYAIVRVGWDKTFEGTVGKIVEWQIDEGHQDKEPWILIRVARWILKKCDFVILSVDAQDSKICGCFKKLMPSVSRNVASIGAGRLSPLRTMIGYKEPSNWRIRPGMGDMCFF